MRSVASQSAPLPLHPFIFNSRVPGSTRIHENNFSLCPFEYVFPALLRYSWHRTLSNFKVYHVVIWYMYIFQNVYHNLVNTSCTSHSYHFVVAVVVRTLIKLDHHSNFQVHNSILLTPPPCSRHPGIHSSYKWTLDTFTDTSFPIPSALATTILLSVL